MQCVIFRTSDGTAVRQWSRNTLLNGRPFDTASVRVGDRLTLGPVELEFVAPESKDSTSAGPEPAAIDQPVISDRKNARPATVDQPQQSDDTRTAADQPDLSGSAESAENISPANISPENIATSADHTGASWPAAQEVFRHLQAANEINRHRARKLISTLRKDRGAIVQLKTRLEHLQRQLDQHMHEMAKRDAPDSDDGQELPDDHAGRMPPDERGSQHSQVSPHDPIAGPIGTADSADTAQSPPAASALVPSTLPDSAAQPSEPWRHASAASPNSTAPPPNAGETPRLHRSPEPLSGESEAESTGDCDDWLTAQMADIERRGKDAAQSSDKSAVLPDATEVSHHQDVAEPQTDAASAPSLAPSTESNAPADSEEYFPGFSKSAATVDQELLGPLPKLRRPAARPAQQPRDVPSGHADAPDDAVHETPPPSPDDISHDHTGSADDRNREDAALPVADDDPQLPGASTPSIPGLSDSAVEHLRKLSIWKGDPEESSDDESGSSVGATPTAPSPTVDATAESAEPDTPQTTSTSFIERFAPLLAGIEGEEAPSIKGSSDGLDGTGQTSPAPTQPGESPHSTSLAGSKSHQDDESIEEYMAKLMQRVRGESPSVATPGYSSYGAHQPSSSEPSSGSRPLAAPADHGVAASAFQSPDAEEQAADVAKADAPALSTLDELKRSEPVPEHATDMKALRELANQTARHAIGVHASRKHRESAVSRLIVAGFALISGSFLLATSNDGLSIKFVSGCVASIAALYWGALTLRSLLRSMKPGADNSSKSDPFNPPLPIAGKDEIAQRDTDVRSES